MQRDRQFQSIHVGHQYIGDDEVRRTHLGDVEALPSIARLLNNVALPFQYLTQETRNLWIVVDDQYGCDNATPSQGAPYR